MTTVVKTGTVLVAGGAAFYYYLARISNPFRPWLLMRVFAYWYGDAESRGIDPYYGIHTIVLTSVRTLVKGGPNVCPVRTYTFALPRKDVVLANHISLGHGDVVKIHSMMSTAAGGQKNYSPTNVSQPGHLDLTVKLYPDGVNSQAFANLRPGDTISVSGPWPPRGMRAKRLPGPHVHLIAYGVGITEAIHVAQSELQDDRVEKVNLVYANRYRDDVFYREELRELEQKHSRFKVIYLFSREATQLLPGERKGRVSAEILRDALNLPISSDDPQHRHQRFVIPGSQAMIQDTWDKYLKVFGYNRRDHSLLLLKMFSGSKPRTQKMYQDA